MTLAFGANVDGRLGDGSIETRRTPVPVSATVSFEQVDAGDNHSCGITTDGRLFCWGQNINRQLGVDDHAVRAPVQVGEASDWIAVSAGGQHTCGLRAPGRLFCWGDNTEGALGDGSGTMQTQPRQVNGPTGWRAVSAAGFRTCGIQLDGSLWCWGSNDRGGIGDGTTTDRPLPVRIGQETGYLGDDPTSVKQTFFGQTLTRMEQELAAVTAAYQGSTAFTGLAVHDAASYAAMAP